MLYVLATLTGLALLLTLFLVPPLFEPSPADTYAAMFLGAVLAFPASLMYLTVPRLLDRYDPEPWYALVGCLIWGGVTACGFAAVINSAFGAIMMQIGGPGFGETASAVFSAPLVEEALKCTGIWGVAFFLKREFDGVVDGIIYATFTALGFAAVENVIYYSEAIRQGSDVLAFTFALRGVLGPWAHPVYTCMFGIGMGIARETKSPVMKWVAPILGYFGSVFLHFVWNASASIGEGVVFCLMFPLWLLFVGGFLIAIVVLVRRRGRIIREHLVDEVALGTIDQQELDLVASPFGLLRARLAHGGTGAEFVRATARLALSKWHTARAMETKNATVSMDFIVPLRARISELRAKLG